MLHGSSPVSVGEICQQAILLVPSKGPAKYFSEMPPVCYMYIASVHIESVGRNLEFSTMMEKQPMVKHVP